MPFHQNATFRHPPHTLCFVGALSLCSHHLCFRPTASCRVTPAAQNERESTVKTAGKIGARVDRKPGRDLARGKGPGRTAAANGKGIDEKVATSGE
jgi:hypothetical protein